MSPGRIRSVLVTLAWALLGAFLAVLALFVGTIVYSSALKVRVEGSSLRLSELSFNANFEEWIVAATALAGAIAVVAIRRRRRARRE